MHYMLVWPAIPELEIIIPLREIAYEEHRCAA